MGTKRPKGKPKKKSIRAKKTDRMSSKQRLSRLGKEQKKGTSGTAAYYLTRHQAIKRLQIPLKDFRRLCILKGIYPRDPKKKIKGSHQTYYHLKDIIYLSHEPLLETFRKLKIFSKRIKKAIGRGNIDDAKRLYKNSKPKIKLDHLVKERYPTFNDALNDLDDALSLIALFSTMPIISTIHSISKIKSENIDSKITTNCHRLLREWNYYIVKTNSLQKVFISVKGIYYQANIASCKITWLTPHQFTPDIMKDQIDYNVMKTFLEFYQVLLEFVNHKLYTDLNIQYPPNINVSLDTQGIELAAIQIEEMNLKINQNNKIQESIKGNSNTKEIKEQMKVSMKQVKTLNNELENIKEENDNDTIETNKEVINQSNMDILDDDTFASNDMVIQINKESINENKSKNLFKNLIFFLSREIPYSSLEFIILSFGGIVCWDGPNSPYSLNDTKITHIVTDRPNYKDLYYINNINNREFVQPQWIFDSVNNKILLPVDHYLPGIDLPPHLSPFVDDVSEGYIPEYKNKLLSLQSAVSVHKVRKNNNNNVNNNKEISVDTNELNDMEDMEDMDNDEIMDQEASFVAGIKEELKNENELNNISNNNDNQIEIEKNESNQSNELKLTKKMKKIKKEEEMKELAKMMMSRKAKSLYDRMQHGKNKKSNKIQLLQDKKNKIDNNNNRNKN